MKKLPVSVLIPTMNRPESLKRTLEGYLRADCIPAQLVIVDQSPLESTRNAIRKTADKAAEITSVRYFYQQTPSSTMARNKAMAEATEEILIFSDDDVDIFPDTLQQVCNIMADEKVALLAGIDENSSKSSSSVGYLLGTKSFRRRRIGHVTLSMLGRYPDEIQGETETQWAMGYFFAIRSSLAAKWGIRWDEKLTGYAYAEDLDFSYSYHKAAKAEGLRCVLSEKVRLKHLVSREHRTPSQKSTYMYVINRAYLSYKHGMGPKSRMAMGWCNLWRTVERVVKKESARDMLGAIRRCAKVRKVLKKGILKAEFYQP